MIFNSAKAKMDKDFFSKGGKSNPKSKTQFFEYQIPSLDIYYFQAKIWIREFINYFTSQKKTKIRYNKMK